MPRNDRIKILNPIRALDPTRKESPKRRNQRRKQTQQYRMQLNRNDAQCHLPVVMFHIARTRNTRGQIARIPIHAAYLHHAARTQETYQRPREQFECLRWKVGGRLVEYILLFACQFVGEECKRTGGTGHPSEFREEAGEVPSHYYREYASSDESFPCLVGT